MDLLKRVTTTPPSLKKWVSKKMKVVLCKSSTSREKTKETVATMINNPFVDAGSPSLLTFILPSVVTVTLAMLAWKLAYDYKAREIVTLQTTQSKEKGDIKASKEEKKKVVLKANKKAFNLKGEVVRLVTGPSDLSPTSCTWSFRISIIELSTYVGRGLWFAKIQSNDLDLDDDKLQEFQERLWIPFTSTSNDVPSAKTK
ncbi:hypothetical protein PVK06_029823 [Gossypium arboreum]|uniref:Uncharacterized protein n=1 Tax=Gossypium arboreum TaxID=29729 RepID=A0ABR0NPQ3_GOSAR|nr:hypothetical protein PVK06_029823 [Gossypium arboreum]